MGEENWMDTEPIIKALEDPDTLTPREAMSHALTVAAQLSRCRTRLGELQALQAQIKVNLLDEKLKVTEIKIRAEGSQTGKELAFLTEHTKGLEEILKAIKKAMQLFNDESHGYV